MLNLELLLVVVLVQVAVVVRSYLTDTTDCDQVCHNQQHYDETLLIHCGCPNQVQIESQQTTLSMCDYLCSIQMGGSACDCSIALVPGRK